MSHLTAVMTGYEPGLETIEMLCDRLGELGLPVGPDTARDLVRAILSLEAPRVDARMREAIEISLNTIRVAAQSAIGVLAATSPVGTSEPARIPEAAVGARRPIAKRKQETEDAEDLDGDAQRPVFRRPRGR